MWRTLVPQYGRLIFLSDGMNYELYSSGVVLWSATRRLRAWWSPEIAEGKTLSFAVKLARAHNLGHVIFETDCLSLVSRLSKGVLYSSDLDSIMEDACIVF